MSQPNGTGPSDEERIEEKLRILEESEEVFLEEAQSLMEAYGGNVYPLDLLAVAVFNRSISLVSGFCALIRTRNYVCAFPLVRLQVDNLLRFYAAFIVDEPQDFAMSVLDGCKIRDLRDRTGKRMTDAYLKSQMKKIIPWIENIYDEASGFVHLSNRHIFSSIRRSPEDLDCVMFSIGHENQCIPTDVATTAVEAMSQVTLKLLRYLHGWTWTKDNPDKLSDHSPADLL